MRKGPLMMTGHEAPQAGECGAVLVEFALAVPLLVLLFFGLIDFGLYLWETSVLEATAKAAARTISINRPEEALKEDRYREGLSAALWDLLDNHLQPDNYDIQILSVPVDFDALTPGPEYHRVIVTISTVANSHQYLLLPGLILKNCVTATFTTDGWFYDTADLAGLAETDADGVPILSSIKEVAYVKLGAETDPRWVTDASGLISCRPFQLTDL
jgi:hypothetical protein